ncbi:uncharacterized protein Eint_010520 [Encephalitozoon intestinalis ATCC 50506]|uniref:Uncharacterized protein n=1 Tax=Encephalitozoon intestinalis (strain ATCC 50506) TaxID=876142 RepID=E0S5D0_ENCIT|nr:uncharacterized protein Eint_010520 [Encephalitozoon intestinalis ATCC 50506]ADM10915.1 hypothetical protein Eint_010520 [Encephalitozoon intestinalis ATCC 50506]UTX44549.1 DUF5098 domain-containing protein [Encephalitozoon intestinalis]
MEDVENIRTSYKVLKCKCVYLKSYLEHIVTVAKRSSDLLFRALQIPRDIEWNDLLLTHCIEMSERQRAVFDEAGVFYGETLFKELDGLIATIVNDMKMIDEEVKAISERPAEGLKELRIARNRHMEAWTHGKHDPWLTELGLKKAVKKVLLMDDEANNVMYGKVGGFNMSLQSAADRFKETLLSLMRIQKQKYQKLRDSVDMETKRCEEMDRFFDTISESPKEVRGEAKKDEKLKEKVDASFETFVEEISKELSGKGITVRKNLEIVKSSICKVKKGYTGDWIVAYLGVTSTGYAHFFDVSGLLNEAEGLKNIINNLNNSTSKGFISMFDGSKPRKESGEDRMIFEINTRIGETVETLSSPVVSINLNDNTYELDRERKQISVSSKHQNGFASFFGVCEVKIKLFSLSNAIEIFHTLKNRNKLEESIDNFAEGPRKEVNEGVGLKVLLQEENPWVEG